MLNLNELPDLLETVEAARLLRRAPQTLRLWSMRGNGPLQPVRLANKGGLLLWRRRDIERLIGLDLVILAEAGQ